MTSPDPRIYNPAAEAIEPDRLRRELGLLDAVAVGFGAIVGAGIFVVTGVAAGIAGPAFLLSLLIAGVAAACNALSSAQLAAAFPRSGGAYEYGYRLLSPTAGYVAGCMFLTSKMAAAGTVALGFASYLDAVVPGLRPRPIAVAAILFFTALNYVGIRRSSRVNIAIVTLSVGALLLLSAVGIAHVRPDNFTPFSPAGWTGVFQGAALLFFAYTGYARVATLAEEVREPRVTIPKAILITIIGAITLYLLVSVVAVGVVGAGALSSSAAPLYAVASSISPGLATVIAVGGGAAMLGVMLSQVLGLSRVAFAMAARRDLPVALAEVHPRYGVPGRAVVAAGVGAALIGGSVSIPSAASVAAFAILLYYLIVNVAALKLPAERRLYPGWIGMAGAVACLILAVSLSPQAIGGGLTVIVVALVGRALLKR